MHAQTRKQIQRILIRNKRIYLNYNRFRQNLFAQLAPQESEIVLYLLPWLLSINDPGCPGYVPRLKRPFRVYNIEETGQSRSLWEQRYSGAVSVAWQNRDQIKIFLPGEPPTITTVARRDR